jgi:hypothetical protein
VISIALAIFSALGTGALPPQPSTGPVMAATIPEYERVLVPPSSQPGK